MQPPGPGQALPLLSIQKVPVLLPERASEQERKPQPVLPGQALQRELPF